MCMPPQRIKLINVTGDWKYPTTFGGNLPYQISAKSEMVYGLQGKVHFWPYVN
jgi:hypothetical protein